MLGELTALGGALAWAINSVLIRSQSDRMGSLLLNTVQYLAASVPLLLALVLSGRISGLSQISAWNMVALGGTAVISMVIGDTAYVRSLRLLGVSKAFPVAMCSYPLMASFVAIVFLGEPFTWLFIVGAALVLAGLYSLRPAGNRAEAPAHAPSRTTVVPNRFQSIVRDPKIQGLAFALIGAIGWATAVLTLKFVLADVNAFVSTAVRVPIAAAILTALVSRQHGKPKLRAIGIRSIAIISAAGVVGVALGTILFMMAIESIGAARATILFATSPLFALALSTVFLREAVTWRIAGGTALSVAGIALVIL